MDDYFSFALANGGYSMQTSATLVLRNQLLEAGLFAEGLSMGEDIDMWCRLACRGPFFYTARPSAVYNDAQSPTRRSEKGRTVRPFFAQRLPDLIRAGKVPPALLDSSRRYANFDMLEYARQLLDAGEHAEARRVLLNECAVSYDSSPFQTPGQNVVCRPRDLSACSRNLTRKYPPTNGEEGARWWTIVALVHCARCPRARFEAERMTATRCPAKCLNSPKPIRSRPQ